LAQALTLEKVSCFELFMYSDSTILRGRSKRGN